MRKRLIWLLAAILLLGGLAACQSATSEPTATSTSTVAVVARATATPVPSTPTPAPTVTATPEPQATKPAQDSGSKPQPTPTVEWQIPKIGEKDWGKGNPQAGLVLVEYSDFQ
jgi:hypothetical protein